MARKVFISVLGTGFYGKCVYFKDDFKSTETRFIQRATLEMLTCDGSWSAETDKGFILLTEKARTANWLIENNYRLNYQNNKEKPVKEPYTCLHDELIEAQLPLEITPVDIPDGKDEREMWEIFEKVFSLLKEGDELYFDVTHGFRYLPMLVLVLGNYAKFLRNVSVRSLTYGNYEAADRSVKPELAPFVDITPLSVLQDWTNASSDFLRHGDASRLKGLCMKELKPILRETRGADVTAQSFRHLAETLSSFADNLRFCRGLSIYSGEDVVKLRESLEGVEDRYLKALIPLLDNVASSVKGFTSDNVVNLLRASELCLRYGNYQASVTLMQEGMVSFFCVQHEISIEDEKSRELVGRAITKKLFYFENRLQDYRAQPDSTLEKKIDEIYNDDLLTREFVNEYSNLTNVRNDMNHAGMRSVRAPLTVNKLQRNIERCMNLVLGFYDKNSEDVAQEKKKPERSLFTNLSNHPSSQWGEDQLAEAKKLGEIVDMEFPAVNPCAATIELDEMAQKLVDDIRKLAGENNITVHVMGEMSLTYKVVQKLISWGIRCVCSTTQRIVTEDADGRKVTEFHFEQFRDYE